MDIRILHSFVMLAETGNYRKAAQKLFITQPALTKQIQSLERELGIYLFIRGRHGAQLTHAGRQLIDNARELVFRTQEFRQFALNIANGKSGNLAIGFGLAGIKVAPELVARFRQRWPEITISLEDMPSGIQAEALINGRLQLAFMHLPVEPPLTGIALKAESLVLAAPQKDKYLINNLLNSQRNYQALSELPLLRLITEQGTDLNRQVDDFMRFNHVAPRILQEANDIQTLIALVAAGMGTAIVPETAIYIAPTGIEMIPLSGAYSSWEVGMVWNSAQQDRSRDLFISMVKNDKALVSSPAAKSAG